MKTAGRENPIAGQRIQQPSTCADSQKHILLIQVGCEPEKVRRCRSVFLDFYLYRTYQLTVANQASRVMFMPSGSRLCYFTSPREPISRAAIC